MTPRGGARPGSGRKPIGEQARETAAFSLPPDLLMTLGERARAEGKSRSEVVAEALDAFLVAEAKAGRVESLAALAAAETRDWAGAEHRGYRLALPVELVERCRQAWPSSGIDAAVAKALSLGSEVAAILAAGGVGMP